MSTRSFSKLIFAGFAAVAISACGGGGGDSGGPLDPAGGDIDNPVLNPPVANNAYELLQSRTDTTFVAEALNGGGVYHQMSGAGTYTFFAPTDAAMEAWAELRDETIEELLADNNEMYRVMKYHIIPERYAVSELPFGLPLQSVRDEVLKAVNFDPAGLEVGLFDGIGFQSNVDLAESDIVTANATIHLVDRVMMPTQSNVGQLLGQKEGLDMFTAIFEEVLGPDLLTNEGQVFTVLAPNDAAIQAFLDLLGVTFEQLLEAPAGSVLAARRDGIAGYHLIPGFSYFVEEIPKGLAVNTRLLTRDITVDAESLQITDETGATSNFSERDGIAKNGVIHVIDRVLLATPL